MDELVRLLGDEDNELTQHNPLITSSLLDVYDCVVTGGCIASMLLGEKVNDFDIYFRSDVAASKIRHAVVKMYPLKEKSPGMPLSILAITPNSVTLSNKTQLITRFTGTPEEIISNFDFVHCTNYWTKKEGLVLNQPALESLLAKDLKYCGSKFPICSIIRTKKFIRRGWKISAGQYLKVCLQLSSLDMEDMGVVRAQLTGVDVGYFSQLLEWIRDNPHNASVPELLEEAIAIIEELDDGEGQEE
jgi:hypothetical protein